MRLPLLKKLVKDAGMPIDSRLDLRCKITWQYLAGWDVYPKYKARYKSEIVNPWISEECFLFDDYTTNPKEWWAAYTGQVTVKEIPQEHKPTPKSVFQKETVTDLLTELRSVFQLDLFSVSERDVKRAYKSLATKHHPDAGGVAQDFIYISNLKDEAIKHLSYFAY